MKSKAIKIAVTAFVLLLAFGGLLYSTLRDGTEYYKHVDEVMGDPAAWQGKRLQLHGYVVDESILQKPNTLEYRFQVQNNGKVVHGRLHRRGARHVQERIGSRAEGTAERARLRGGAQRRDGEVPVEVPGSRQLAPGS